ncbi:MAG TPA: hypothetical protein VIU12_18890 [Chryseolinea sp.]
MKKLSLKLLLMLTLALPFIIVSCSKDDAEPEELIPKLDGVYIYGTNTVAASAVEPAARMNVAQLDPGKAPGVETQDGVFGKFMYIGAGAKIKVAQVVGGVGTIYGAENGGKKELGTDIVNVPINDMVIHGALVADATEIAVGDEGLYYAYVDINNKNFVIVRVKANMIGDATPGVWATATNLAQKSVSKDSSVFESIVKLKAAAGYRYRFNDGWHVYNEDGVTTVMSSLGVEDYAAAWASGKNDLGFFLSNIPNHAGGNILVKLKYTASNDTWSESKLTDFSATKMGLFGNAYKVGDVEANWDNGFDLKTPTKSGTIYTWKWTDVSLIGDREFVFLENGKWEGSYLVDFSMATSNGSAITDGKVKDATAAGKEYHNFYVATEGKYDITLAVDGKTNTNTVTIVTK